MMPRGFGRWLRIVNRLQPLRSFFQTRAHQLFNGGLRPEHRLRGANGVVCFNLLEAERHEREHGVVDFLVGG